MELATWNIRRKRLAKTTDDWTRAGERKLADKRSYLRCTMEHNRSEIKV